MIELNGLSKVYGLGSMRVSALKDIDLSVSKGDFLAVMGPSGSGKSTLMNIIGFLDKPSKGQYFFNGENMSEMDKVKLAYMRNQKIGFIFQSFFLLPRLTALENVEVPLIYMGIPQRKRRHKAEEMLKRMGLSSRIDHFPNQLSGGQRQRVAIARALINEPPLILADEPTGNLDSRTGKEIMSVIAELHRNGTTVILITHEIEIASYAQRVITLQDGLIVKDIQSIKENQKLRQSI